jgi:hypothetical protein
MRWTQAASGAKLFAGTDFPVSGHGAQDDRHCGIRQNRVVLASVADVKRNASRERETVSTSFASAAKQSHCAAKEWIASLRSQ